MTKKQQVKEIGDIIAKIIHRDSISIFEEDEDGEVNRISVINVNGLGRFIYESGYRKADEVRKETAREILQRLWKWKSSIIFDTESVLVAEAQFEKAILAFAKEEYGVEVEE